MNLVVWSGIAATLVSYVGVVIIRRWAVARSILDIPNSRSSHTAPTPRGGGLAIAGITLICTGVLLAIDKNSSMAPLLFYLLGGVVVAAISWWDDLRSTPVGIRLLVHSVAAVLAILGIGALTAGPLPPILSAQVGWVGPVITFLWIVGLTNAYNFMDGIDGIAGLQAVVAGGMWAFVTWKSASLPICLLSTLLACGSLGFLGLNWPPAKIFMGDVGSAFLGYSFAVLPLLAHKMSDEGGHVYLGILVVWPFVYDTSFTFIRRAIRRESLFQSHRSHLYQRLMIAGWKVRDITLLYGGLAFLSGLVGVYWYRSTVNLGAFIGVLLAPGAVLTLLVRYSERRASQLQVSLPLETRGTVSKN
jgi:UDP-N-acetylmuramyl pentapeptide phosphotransferase/UDP-N-acetylglucosamine-1-phosphate transferase